MRRLALSTAILTLFITLAKSHLIWDETKHLHPVHGLYVKPSDDGTTGDLYVAASENDGVKTWLTDQPIGFLSAATESHPALVKPPVSIRSSVSSKTTPNEEIITKQKQATVQSPPFKFAYAVPVPASDGSVLTYPYTITDGKSTPFSEGTPVSPYSALQYYYPQMLSSIATAVNSLSGTDGEKTDSPLATQYWANPYPYPYPYMMIDPNAWAMSQKEPTSHAAGTSHEI